MLFIYHFNSQTYYVYTLISCLSLCIVTYLTFSNLTIILNEFTHSSTIFTSTMFNVANPITQLIILFLFMNISII